MNDKASRNSLSRRDFLKIGGGLLGATAGSVLVGKAVLRPEKVTQAAANAPLTSLAAEVMAQTEYRKGKELHFVGTDGWVYMPPGATVAPYHPDDMAPDPFTTYIFGFRDVTSVTNNSTKIYAQKMKAQLTAPLFWFEQETDNLLKLTNLGLELRPDLIDAHTLHFHGFRNAIPIFDGEPHSSVGVPIARDLTYFYRPHDPGTYMYHCHFEETEHVHMGMIGPCFITPILNYGKYTRDGEVVEQVARMGGSTDPTAPRGYVFNDPATAYDREFVLVLSEVWTVSHWCDSHVQLPEWSDYAPEFYMINGRVYPDTLAPNGPGTEQSTGDLIIPTERPELQYQPLSSLITANAGDRVLLRIINLGFEQQAVQMAGIKLTVVGKDATQLKGRNGADLSFVTNTVSIGPGESVDAIFVAPDHSGGTTYDRYLFHNRNYHRLNNGGHTGYGGQMTEVHVYPNGTLDPQDEPNT